MNTSNIQQILGPGKDGNLFTVHTSKENPDELHVFFGLAYLEKVKNSTESFQYKYLLARLYNAGYKRNTLQETFGHAISTLRSWGNAVLTGDIDIILSAFAGRGGKKKVTEEIEKFIKTEYLKIYPYNKYSYSREIISGIKEVFNETISGETVRKVLSKDKNKTVPESSKNISKNTETEASSCETSVVTASKNYNNRNSSLSSQTAETEKLYIHHLGIVLAFWMYKALKVENKIIEQWLSIVLLGKVNFEQAESLNFDSLDFLHGFSLLRKAKSHHTVLTHLSHETDNIDNLFQKNAVFNGKETQYCYYDPHSIKYTGMRNILKGWCGSAGKITRVNYQDFFHSSGGYPLYFEIHDNSIDMRERFIGSVDNFTEKITNGVKKTFIIDRGIYGRVKMQAISEKGYGLVTWEKNYKNNAWNDEKVFNSFDILRYKNHSADIKVWNVKYMRDESESKIPDFYKLIVRVTPPGKNKKECEAAILTNGKIDDRTAVFAMLNRWIQENDFRYLVLNFGLNQITSYKSTKYDRSEQLLAEKTVISESYKIVRKAVNKKEKELSEILLKTAEKSKGESIEMNDKILKLKAELAKMRNEKKNIQTYENKLDKMINDGAEKLAADKKYMLDTVKITARNIFYKLLETFRPLYNNYRNDHTILRELIRSNGYIYSENNILHFKFDLPRRLENKQKQAVDKFIKQIEDKINDGCIFSKQAVLSVKNYSIENKKRAFNLRLS